MADRTPEEEAQARAEKDAARAERQRQRAAEEEPTYPVERLIAESDAFFAQPPYVLEGALELAGGSKKNLTHAEAKAAIDEYLAHEDTSRPSDGEEQ